MALLFAILMVIQVTLLIPILLVFANYWEEEKMEGERIHATLLNFITIMAYGVAVLWFLSTLIDFISLSSGVTVGVWFTGTSVAIIIIFVLCLMIAVFNEIRIRSQRESE